MTNMYINHSQNNDDDEYKARQSEPFKTTESIIQGLERQFQDDEDKLQAAVKILEEVKEMHVLHSKVATVCNCSWHEWLIVEISTALEAIKEQGR